MAASAAIQAQFETGLHRKTAVLKSSAELDYAFLIFAMSKLLVSLVLLQTLCRHSISTRNCS
jgi:hypothetical protein